MGAYLLEDDTNVLLSAVERQAKESPDSPAFFSAAEGETTYGELWRAACGVARGLARKVAGRGPVLVLGPKSALTVASFLGCLMSGHAYVPVDAELPARRVSDIAGQIEGATMLATCGVPEALRDVLPPGRVIDAAALLSAGPASGEPCAPLPREQWVSGEETQYIIFTSGTTGRPKGIEVTASNVTNFRRWLAGFPVVRDGGRVFLDQAHYSFDLSEYELVGALTTGGCLHAVDASAASDFRALFADLSASGVEVWVSTPSFADMCLADPSFDLGLLHCAGRLDSLVKLNGFRIELGEVEGALEEAAGVRHAVVVPATRAGRVASLCAFVVADKEPGQTSFMLGRALKAELARSLPAYMVPRQIRVLDEMPLNANGKADRKALAASVSR